jgi:hypothetical protein
MLCRRRARDVVSADSAGSPGIHPVCDHPGSGFFPFACDESMLAAKAGACLCRI